MFVKSHFICSLSAPFFLGTAMLGKGRTWVPTWFVSKAYDTHALCISASSAFEWSGLFRTLSDASYHKKPKHFFGWFCIVQYFSFTILCTCDSEFYEYSAVNFQNNSIKKYKNISRTCTEFDLFYISFR